MVLDGQLSLFMQVRLLETSCRWLRNASFICKMEKDRSIFMYPMESGSMHDIQYLPETKEYRLYAEVFLSRSRDEVFSFFSDAHNLEALTPELLNFHVLMKGPIEMFEGQLIDYRLKVHGIPIRWQSRISVWEPPFRFVDEQLRGPYIKWYHEHRFVEQAEGTLVVDEVHYKPPGGRLMNWLAVERDVRKIFAFRGEELLRRFPDPSSAQAQPA